MVDKLATSMNNILNYDKFIGNALYKVRVSPYLSFTVRAMHYYNAMQVVHRKYGIALERITSADKV